MTMNQHDESGPKKDAKDAKDASVADVLAQAQLTRRDFLAGAAVTTAAVVTTAAAAVAGCAPFGQGTTAPFALHRPATVAFDATVPANLHAPLLQRLSGAAGIPSANEAAAAQAADLVITLGGAPSGYVTATVGASPLALFTHMRVPVDEITHDQALKLLGGQVGDWKDVGAPYGLAVHLFALDGLALPAGVQVADGAKRLSSLDDVIAAVRGQPGSLTALPADATDWRVRNLGVDGVYPAQGRGDASKGGLAALTLQVGVTKALAQQGLSAKAVAATLVPELAPATVVNMVAVGDIMLARGVLRKIELHNDFTYPYQLVHDHLQAADFRVANIECTITDVAKPDPDPFTFHFVSPTRAVDGLTYAGFNAVTVANNHSGDVGWMGASAHAGLSQMRDSLQAKGIGVCGGGNNLADARQPAITTVKGVRIALLGYHDNGEVSPAGPMATDGTWGLAPANKDYVAQDIAAARAKADIVIPYFHWGIEYHKVPDRRQQGFARAAIDAGADMVLGNHPHWTQGIEEYKGKLIIYSMGNFVFDQWNYIERREAMLLHLFWRGTSLVSVGFVPTLDVDVDIVTIRPRIMSQAEAVNVFQRMWSGTDLLAAGQYGIA
jgi:poly-gamma-glutamate synthesis protein (capsule biosynthesis protein)